ncbi:MAG TPA: hypothetical protein VMZ71_06045 [Gemmataceae bacterium]|nr:hypothetical protein [Gemmataceae bacterium]
MTTPTTRVFDVAADVNVDALVLPSMTAEQVVAAEVLWRPHRLSVGGEHSHWDWALKIGRIAIPGSRIVGVECRGAVEGMALIFERGYFTRLPPDVGRPLLYVDFIEAAPWNLRTSPTGQRYAGVGLALMRFAVEKSVELGCGGRVGLHSLPQSERFYAVSCGMLGGEVDFGYYGLKYYEFTQALGTAFLEE